MSYCKITNEWYPASEMQIAYYQGEKMLVGPEVETILCDECEEVFVVDDTEFYSAYKNGHEVCICEDCKDSLYYICDDCLDLYHEDEITYINGCHYCDQCRDDNFTECQECGEWINNEDTFETEHGDYICARCLDYDNYVLCERCGRYTRDPYYDDNDEDGDRPFCESCWNFRNEEERYSVVHRYGYKPRPIFHKTKDEEITEEFFGMEIEAEGDRGYAEEFLNFFKENQVYLKHDGSVDGFEIVTHPMTRNYFYEEFVPNLRGGMKLLREYGFRGHNRAGIHIHVSESAISMKQLEKLMLLLYPEQDSIYQKWLAITQRHDDKMRQWSKMRIDDSKKLTKTRKKEVKAIIDNRIKEKYSMKPYIAPSRYTAINMSNDSTIEFRIFNSNMRIERIIKNMQVIFSLLDFTKTDKLPTYHNYIRFVEEHKDDYKEFWEFLLEKGIYQPKENKQRLKEVITTLKQIDNEILDYKSMMERLNDLNPNKVAGIDDNDEVEGGQPCVPQF